MMSASSEADLLLRKAFRMPSVQTMMSRKSSITNAFVNSIIPVIEPSPDEIREALTILGMRCDDVRCAYCGAVASEWDHLRPLVVNRRPTGYISEIANLVPSCGKCNQSKGNKNWEAWVLSNAPQSPRSRGVADLAQRVERLRSYERWRRPVCIRFEEILGPELWAEYWRKLDEAIEFMRECQAFADDLRHRIVEAHKRRSSPLSAGSADPVTGEERVGSST
jgi:hypothetical protein